MLTYILCRIGGALEDKNKGYSNPDERSRTFAFDQVFSGEKNQKDIYDKLGIAKMVSRAVDVSIVIYSNVL